MPSLLRENSRHCSTHEPFQKLKRNTTEGQKTEAFNLSRLYEFGLNGRAAKK